MRVIGILPFIYFRTCISLHADRAGVSAELHTVAVDNNDARAVCFGNIDHDIVRIDITHQDAFFMHFYKYIDDLPAQSDQGQSVPVFHHAVSDGFLCHLQNGMRQVHVIRTDSRHQEPDKFTVLSKENFFRPAQLSDTRMIRCHQEKLVPPCFRQHTFVIDLGSHAFPVRTVDCSFPACTQFFHQPDRLFSGSQNGIVQGRQFFHGEQDPGLLLEFRRYRDRCSRNEPPHWCFWFRLRRVCFLIRIVVKGVRTVSCELDHPASRTDTNGQFVGNNHQRQNVWQILGCQPLSECLVLSQNYEALVHVFLCQMDQVVFRIAYGILLYRSVNHGTDRMQVGYGVVSCLGCFIFRICLICQDLLDSGTRYPVGCHFCIGTLQLRDKAV